MVDNKIIVTSCIAISTATVAAFGYRARNSSEIVSGDGELETPPVKTCRCPFSTPMGVGLATGLLSGTVSWVLYDKV